MVLPEYISYTVKPKWLEYLWNHGNLFEKWAVPVSEGLSWRHVRKQMVIILGSCFLYLLYIKSMLSVLTRITSMVRF